jgi:transcriptional regulator with XRE-family HTH domain
VNRTQKPDLKAIGKRIRGLRGRIRQEEFANQLGLSQGQLSKLETGKAPPTLEILVLLANRFETTLDWIVRGD